jgi:hypothetical protein
MIHLTEPNGTKHRVHHSDVVAITEAGPASQGHGVRAVVRLGGAGLLSVTETPDWIEAEKERQRATERPGVDYQTKVG